MTADRSPCPSRAATTLAWYVLAPPALWALLLLGRSLLPQLLPSRPDAVVALTLCLGTSALLAWNLAWVVIASLASARPVPGHLRRLLAAAVRASGTAHARRMLHRAGAVAGLGVGLLSACSEAPGADPLGDDLSWGVVLAAPATPSQAPSATWALPPSSTPTTEPTERESPVPTTQPPPRTDPGPLTHTVVVGDTLWGIASGLLGDGADDAEITRTWQRIHELNRDLVGEDPDLILPGTVLSVEGVLP